MQRLISLLIVALLSLFALIIVLNFGTAVQTAQAVIQTAGIVARVVMWGLAALLLGTPVFVGGLALLRNLERRRRQRDGSYPLIFHKLPGGARMIVDPNAMLSSAAVIDDNGFRELNTGVNPEAQLTLRQGQRYTAHLQAIAPGDDIFSTIGGMVAARQGGLLQKPIDRTAARILNDKSPRAPRVAPPLQLNSSTPTPATDPQLSLTDSLQRSNERKFIMGQSDNGSLAIFDLDMQHNIGIIGSQGTGKSHGSGYQVTLAALRSGYHVVILDPKGGVDFRQFATNAEWHETDPWTLGDQVSTLYSEHEQRLQLLRQHGAANLWELNGHGPPRVMVIIEEFGALMADLKLANAAAAKEIETKTALLMRTARSTGIHFCFIDQDTEHWTGPIRGGTKCRLIYRVDENEAFRLRAYDAMDLPDRGAFLMRKRQYQAWHVEPRVGAACRELPPLPYPRLIVDGQSPTPPPQPPPTPLGSEPTSSAQAAPLPKWRDLVADWFKRNPDALSGPPQGISDIAREMAAAEGDTKPHTAYKSIASQMFHMYRQEYATDDNRLAADILRQHGFIDNSVTIRPGNKNND